MIDRKVISATDMKIKLFKNIQNTSQEKIQIRKESISFSRDKWRACKKVAGGKGKTIDQKFFSWIL